jgi:hypothetical protein
VTTLLASGDEHGAAQDLAGVVVVQHVGRVSSRLIMSRCSISTRPP